LDRYNHGLVEGTAIAFTGGTEENCKEHLRLNDGMDKAFHKHGGGVTWAQFFPVNFDRRDVGVMGGNIEIVMREIGCRLGSVSRREHQMMVPRS
jgi:hypothetical protein